MAFLNKKFNSLRAGLLALGLVITTQNAQADTSAETNMKFGVTVDGGIAVRPFMEKDKLALGPEVRPTLFFEYKFADWLGLRTGIGYAKTMLASGLKNQVSNPTFNIFNLHMLSVPLVARFYPGEERKFSLYIGPRLGWIVGGKKLENIDEARTSDKLKIFNEAQSSGKDISSDEKKLQLLLDLGFDYETDFGLFFGMEGIGFALGYNLGALL